MLPKYTDTEYRWECSKIVMSHLFWLFLTWPLEVPASAQLDLVDILSYLSTLQNMAIYSKVLTMKNGTDYLNMI